MGRQMCKSELRAHDGGRRNALVRESILRSVSLPRLWSGQDQHSSAISSSQGNFT